ncbi:MAG: response regulator [Bacteroidia bacterium]|nr:response regulator [Bacteroidia bacterium]
MIKILVADDEPDMEALIRQRFRQKIRENEYEFVFAENGRIALEHLRAHNDFDIVLSDINMPEMDGLTLLNKVCEELPLIKSVIISAYGDIENIRVAMNNGAFDFITKPVNFLDLEKTLEKTILSVNHIKKTLQAIKENDILRMYVDENVLNFMNSRAYTESLTENENIEATVAFIDICGFTAISEKQSPNIVVHHLNQYFDVMVRDIIAHDGIVDKFIGDCIMAVFKGEYHLDKGIEACLDIKKSLAALPDDELFSPKVSIGINSGEMVSGNIGSATLRRLDFTVIGDTVNTAQRIQSIAQPNQILVNQDCYEKIKKSFQCNRIGSFKLKNKAAEITVYEILS